MEKIVELCGLCAAKAEDGYKVTRLARPNNNKIFCALCQRKRYGGQYRLEKKEGKPNDLS